jgi:hypothetical protein
LLLAHRQVRPIRLRFALALALLPFLLAGRALSTGGFHGALNISYASAPLKAQSASLPLREYENGHLSDVAIQMVPWRKAIARALEEGRLPLRNPYSLSGDILLAGYQAAPFHPATLLALLLPVATGWTLSCALTLFLAAAAAYLFLRELDVGDVAAIFGGAAFMLSNTVVVLQGWPNGRVFAALPLTLLGLARLARGGRGGRGILAAGLLLMLLGGHGESVLFCTAGAGVVFLFQLARSRAPMRAIRGSLLAGALALGLSAAALLPFLEALPQTHESRYREEIFAGVPKSTTLRKAVASAAAFVLPQAYRGVPAEALEPTSRFGVVSTGYAGGLVLALAVVGIARRRRDAAGLFAAGLLALLYACGVPLFTDAVASLPLFEIAIPEYAVAVAAFAACALAAIGLDAILQSRRPAGVLPILSACVLLAAIGVWWRSKLLGGALSAVPHDTALTLLVGPPLILAAALWLRAPAAVLGSLAIAVLFLSRLAEAPPYYLTFSKDLFYPRIPEIESLPKGVAPYRVTGLHYALVPNQSVFYALEDPRGYQAMTNRRYFETYPLWSVHQPVWFNRVDDATRPFLSFLNVRFALGEPRDTAPAGWRTYVRGPHCAIFENPNVLPRAFAPRRVVYVRDAAATVEAMAAVADFSQVAWIEGTGRSGEAENGEASVSLRRDGSGWRVDVDAAGPSWIVVSEVSWKGWRAHRDGGRVAVFGANHAFLAMEVPAGRHRIRLSYLPGSFVAGVAISLVTIGVAVLFTLRIRSRRIAAGNFA